MTSPIEDELNQSSEQSKRSNRDDIPPEYLGSVLRAEILPEDSTYPDRPDLGSILQRFDFRRIGILAVIIILIGVGLVCVIGPGKPYLENSLSSLRDESAEQTSTRTLRNTPLISKTTQVLPTSTIKSTKTSTGVPSTKTPTLTQTMEPTQGEVCADPLNISLADVGKTMCVKGIIVGMEKREVEFIIYFSNERGIFYLVSYDFVWDQAEAGDCIQVRGEVQRIVNTPIMIFSWNNIPEICP